jgi:uncharacterized protein
MPGEDAGAGVQARLRAALKDALRKRELVAVSALRSALSAIGNAEVVSVPEAVPGAGGSPIAGAVAGLGAGEARRRSLSAAEVDQIVRTEISERLLAAGDYEHSGHADRAQRLRCEASALMLAMAGQAPEAHEPG